MNSNKPKIGLIMSGGGARAAYQVGVLKAISEMLPPGSPNPFAVICGASAGAINSAAVAAYAHNFQNAVRRLERVWGNFRVHHVFRADALGMMMNWLRWWGALFFGGMGKRSPVALLDRTPLYRLLKRHLPCDRIQSAIDAGLLHALSIAASGYGSGQSVTFYQGVSTITPWRRSTRVGSATEITVDHLMASSAIPLVFQAVPINREYFGDGSMRQIAPLSPAIHLGAERLLVIGARQEGYKPPERNGREAEYPSLAQIGGHILSSIFLDALEADMERMRRINETLRRFPTSHPETDNREAALRPVESLMISPSQDVRKIAERHKHHFPWPMRILLRGLGAYRRGGGELLSYLLFEKPYCQELMRLGYDDAVKRRDEVLRLLSIEDKVTSLAG
jgi:NTE family protein